MNPGRFADACKSPESWKECAESCERRVHTGTAGSRDHRATVSHLEPRFDPSLTNRTRRSAEVAVGRQEVPLSPSLSQTSSVFLGFGCCTEQPSRSPGRCRRIAWVHTHTGWLLERRDNLTPSGKRSQTKRSGVCWCPAALPRSLAPALLDLLAALSLTSCTGHILDAVLTDVNFSPPSLRHTHSHAQESTFFFLIIT